MDEDTALPMEYELDQAPVGTVQSHLHEFEGSTRLAEEEEDRHNHRFAGMTSMVILTETSHIHAFFTDTDFLDHFHQVAGLTGPPHRRRRRQARARGGIDHDLR